MCQKPNSNWMPCSSNMVFSSSPLREALNRLVQEGLVKADERRGFRVAAMSPDDLADITKMRLMLDVTALHESIQHGRRHLGGEHRGELSPP